MLTFRRALVLALTVLLLFLFFRSHHSSTQRLKTLHSPKPTGSFQEAQPDPVLQDHRQVLADAVPDTDSQAATVPSILPDPRGQSAYKKPKPKPRPKSQAQAPLTDAKRRTLSQQLEYQFPYDPEGKFPGYIWQTWKYTPASSSFTEEWRTPEAKWTELHPHFVHEVITDDVAVNLVRHLYASVPSVLEAYNALPVPVLKADFFRYLILLARGGIYTDIDTMALKSAAEWVPSEVPRSSYGLVVGIEADPDRPDWQDWYSRRIQFCQWTIQSKPGHPVLRDIVSSITEETLLAKQHGTSDQDHMLKSIMEFTGPAVWTDKVFDYFNNPEYFDMSTSKGNITWEHFTGMTQAKKVGDVIVLPITSFSPGVQQMGAGEDDDPMAFVKHFFEGTWKPESERHIGEY